MGSAEATFRGQLSGSGKRANPVIHPFCTAWRGPRRCSLPEFSMAKKFVLNSDRSNNTEAHENQN